MTIYSHNRIPKQIFIILLVLLSQYSSSQVNRRQYKNDYVQDTNRINRSSRFVTGGNIGVQVGSYTFIDISPALGYKVTEKFIPGISISYKYLRFADMQNEFETNIYGGSIFFKYLVLENLFAHVEYEILNFDRQLFEPSKSARRINIESLLVGAGYRQEISRNFHTNLLVLWNLNETIYTFYSNPIIRVSFDIGL
ncbi:MAG: hypothetical protein PHD97_08520 [Bacteroidales bacterium]|nr:hypothetical protein [Bacteroidales bacterium]